MIGGGRGTVRGGGTAATVHGAGPRGVAQVVVLGPVRGTHMADAGPARALERIPAFLAPCLYQLDPDIDANAMRGQEMRHVVRRKSVSSKSGSRGQNTPPHDHSQ